MYHIEITFQANPSRVDYINSVLPKTLAEVCSNVAVMRYILRYECAEEIQIWMLEEYDQCL